MSSETGRKYLLHIHEQPDFHMWPNDEKHLMTWDRIFATERKEMKYGKQLLEDKIMYGHEI